MSNRVMFYVQHLLGIGHVKRAAAIAQGLTARGLTAQGLNAHGFNVSMVLGGPPVTLAQFPDISVYQLPPVRASTAGFDKLVDSHDQPITEQWRQMRRLQLIQTYHQIKPDILIVELFPFGRRQFRFELIPLLQIAAPHTRIVCSLRDVLVSKPEPRKTAWMVETARRYFDHILVHGDKNVIALEESFPAAAALADRISYTGYVVDPAACTAHHKAKIDVNDNANDNDSSTAPIGVNTARGLIVVSTGGGAVGANLLKIAVQTAIQTAAQGAAQGAAQAPAQTTIETNTAGGGASPPTDLSQYHWLLLAGDNLPEDEFAALAQIAPHNVTIERARPDFSVLLNRASLSISQGGYNTVMDVLAARCTNVIIPFADGAESEQTQRALAFAKRGLVTVIDEKTLTPETLAAAARAALNGPAPVLQDINMDGVATTAQLLRQMQTAPRAPHAPDVRRPFMSAPWRLLHDEIRRFEDAGLAPTFWWRDDDAIEQTPQLERMIALANQYAVPLTLAVIPASARPELAAYLNPQSLVSVVQHGYCHTNHGQHGAKKCEFPNERAVDKIRADLERGQIVLKPYANNYRLFVPPWNRMDRCMFPHLAALGFGAISQFGPMGQDQNRRVLQVLNTHIDVIAWRGARGFVGLDHAIGAVCNHLAMRRLGQTDKATPTGLLTHHLVHDEKTWQFVEALFQFTRNYSTIKWLSVANALSW